MKFVCKECSNGFESSHPFECPYCGRDNFEKEKDASELLNEIEGLLKR